MNRSFFATIMDTQPIVRDTLFEKNLDSIVSCVGKVVSVDVTERYGRQFRVVLQDPSASLERLQIKYYLYSGNKDSIGMLSEDDIFEFTGQFMAYTPVNIKRDTYILDIVLEKGIIVVK